MALTKRESRIRIKMRIRKRVSGTAEAPRLSVFRSNKNFYAQIIDDVTGKTLVSASSKSKDFAEKSKIKKVEQAASVGAMIAQKAVQSGITEVKFDRNGYLYHGRVKSFAESARKAGLKF
jgi:large subunit ribosomal protein L18